MFSIRRVSSVACLFGAALLLSTPFARASHPQPSSGAAQLTPPGVSVTPDAEMVEAVATGSGGHVLTFTVTNTGSELDTYEITCTGVARAKCNACSPTRLTLGAGESSTVDVSFEVSDAGAGLVSLIAFSPVTRARDAGSYRVPVNQ